MSQAAAKPRDPIDLDDFERKLRGSVPDVRNGEDPLQELSRLIGAQPDPFDQLFAAGNQPAAPQAQQHVQPHTDYRMAPRQLSATPPPPPAYQPGVTPGHRFDSPFNARQDTARLSPPPLPPSADANEFSELLSQFPDAPARFAAAHPADETAHQSYDYDQAYAQQPSYDEQAYDDMSARPPSRRPLYLMGAALIVLIGGIGAVVINRASHSSSGTPTIQASDAPVKVQPVAQAESLQAQQQQQAVSVLDKSNTERLAASRVVNREEQPVDIQATARAARASETGSNGSPLVAAPSGATANNNGMFPEPRRVKTVSVRPDGSVITGEMAPTPSAAAPSATGAPRPPSMALVTPPPPARPTASTDRAAIDRLAAEAAGAPPKATARATPTVANVDRSQAEPAAPAAARAKPADTTASTGGAYAAQLAAPASEAEARSVMTTLAKRYGSELGGHKLTWRKAKVGDKTVYRVRAGNLSQEAANGICNKMQAKGGSCFVARN